MLDALRSHLVAARRNLPLVSLESLERAGVLSQGAGPAKFRHNFGKTFRLTPALWATPSNTAELQQVVAYAYQAGLPIKPIGSLCTWSPSAQPESTGIALL